MMVRARMLAVAVPLLLQQAGAVAVPGRAGAQEPGRPTSAARAVVWEAVMAVEGDSAAAVRGRWERRAAADPADRAALLGLATIDRLAARYDEARRGYLSIVARTPAADGWSAFARTGLGSVEQAVGDHRAAEQAYRRAAAEARAAREPAAEVQALIGVARARSRLDGPLAALALLDSVGPLVPPADLRLRATYGAGRAAILAQLGRPEARETALECVELAQRAMAPRAEVACYQPLAMDAERRGDTGPAITLLEQVAARNRQANDRWALANTLHWQGHLLSTRGEYERARHALHGAVRAGEASGNGAALAWAALRLARISRHLQDRAAASDLVARSVSAFMRQGDVAGAMEARELQVTLALDVGDFASAHRLAAEQLDWAVRSGRPRLQFTARLGQATIAERQRDWAAAVAALDSAAAVMHRHGMTGWMDVLLYQRGRIALRRGRLDAAAGAFRAHLALLDRDQHVLRHRTRARLADVLARQDRLAEAERELAAAGDELDAWRATLTDQELHVATYQLGDDEDPDLGVPGVIARLAADGQVRSAFALAERRRARSLADRLARASAARSDGARAPITSLARSFTPSATASGLASALPDEQTALLEFVTGSHGAPTTLLVVSRLGGKRVIRAELLQPADSLAPDVARLVALLESGGDPRALSRSLGARLVDPALRHLGPAVRRLVIVPDGPLHRLPFDALRTDDGRFVLERFAVSGAPSAAIVGALLRTPRSPAGAHGARLLAFGDPAFANERAPVPGDDATFVSRLSGDRDEPLPRLVESGREARMVAAFARDAVVRLRDEASESFLKSAPLAGFDVIHFATHAVVDDLSADRTALALAPGGGETGEVTPGDLASLRLAADLVVLSACRTAAGVVVAGEGVQGLTAPLLQAGARAVVATGWRIDDRHTVAFVERLYAALADGQPVSEALRTAKLDAVRRGRPAGEWAAFGVMGDPMVTVALVRPAHRPSDGAPAAFLLVAAGALVAWLGARRMARG